MNRTIGNTISVLIVTLFVALAVFGTVQLTGRVMGTTAVDTGTNAVVTGNVVAASNTSGQTLVCPRTGCTASSCHALQ